ncbi:hypothetical protein [Paenibacillus caseinilyticus]|uniref:hypothetical protein n=1 Tax=Paenibacillus caseinilyticus TaxID=3098138 RepID=UPI0022B904C5|nr:hypothetical protein [Paenibacillus caseinilyticus]MCZ8519351.1 hypothetical protein [Paenibacillus caseinilyticus]
MEARMGRNSVVNEGLMYGNVVIRQRDNGAPPQITIILAAAQKSVDGFHDEQPGKQP